MEYLGTIASVFILISFSFNNEKYIRIINIIGALLFVIYGIQTGAFSVWFLNTGLIIIHIYKLIRMNKSLQTKGDE